MVLPGKERNFIYKRVFSCRWWKECRKITKMFRNQGDDIRGGGSLRLDLSSMSEPNENWRKGVMKNLQIEQNTITELKQVTVMMHHWTEK